MKIKLGICSLVLPTVDINTFAHKFMCSHTQTHMQKSFLFCKNAKYYFGSSDKIIKMLYEPERQLL